LPNPDSHRQELPSFAWRTQDLTPFAPFWLLVKSIVKVLTFFNIRDSIMVTRFREADKQSGPGLTGITVKEKGASLAQNR